MMESDKPSLSLSLIKIVAEQIFRENDSYDDKKGLHPNTIRRSSGLAVNRILVDYGINSLDLYSALKGQESLPDVNNLFAQGFSAEDIDRNIKAMLGTLVHKAIIASSPGLVADQEYRIKLFGRL